MLDQIKQKALKQIEAESDLKNLEAIYRQYLGKKGELTLVLRSLKKMSEKQRKQKGKLANQVKKEIEIALHEKQGKGIKQAKVSKEWIDVTAPGVLPPQGNLNPITLVQRQVEETFQSMGFSVLDGPEIETEYYNFDALNIPKNHPARDQWDTFWLKNLDLILRTHTSPMQARYMEKNSPPLRIIVPGRCFRHEATDASHDFQFHQVEGLMVGSDISVANFKGIIEEFLKKFFSPDVRMRLRPGYFPFVEPGFEIDIKRKDRDWLEIMGAGMVHPNVFRSVGYKSGKWQGFAFGVGIDRLAMLKYGVDDVRLFHSNDLRFLRQF